MILTVLYDLYYNRGADWMKFYVAVTESNWFNYLSSINPDEVNFWKHSIENFRAIDTGDLFLFKLRYPENYIVGGGYFFRNINLSVSDAWKTFEEGNGAKTAKSFSRQVYESRDSSPLEETELTIGCNVLLAPFFFEERDWISAPDDWKPNIVQGKIYDTETVIGKEIYGRVKERLMKYDYYNHDLILAPFPKLGQGSFKIIVKEAYGGRCAITGEKSLPVLEATYIKPYLDYGPNTLDNGILLRSDLRILYDRGYLTITNDYRVKISNRLKVDYGEDIDYYKLHGKDLSILPEKFNERPAQEYINWHNDNVFLS